MQTRYPLSAALLLSTFVFAATAMARTAPEADDLMARALRPADAATDSGVLRNANECGPNAPEAAWSRDGRLLGYRCVTPNANGA
jgi:hypothetical protein